MAVSDLIVIVRCVVRRAQPIYVGQLEDLHASVGADRQSGQVRPARRQVAQQRRQTRTALLREALPRVRQCFTQAILLHRLEHVVEGVHAEGAQRVLVERRHEDDRGQLRHLCMLSICNRVCANCASNWDVRNSRPRTWR